MEKIVIIGAGFGGLVAALNLEKRFRKNPEVSITLIDRHDYQLFAPNLYEVATADEEFTSAAQLKKSIAVPLKEVLRGRKITFIQGPVNRIRQGQREVSVGTKTVPYDYLIVAGGSVSDYFSVPGADAFAMPLKTLPDALAVRNRIEFAMQSHRYDMRKETLHFLVAGGGYTGVEFAAELSRMLDLLAWKNQYPSEKIEITVVEAAAQLVAGFSERMSADVLARLKAMGVRVELSSMIASVSEHYAELASGERMPYDVLVWTTGVRAPGMPFEQAMACDPKSRMTTNEFLEITGSRHMFALGDAACIIGVNGKPMPPTAEHAVKQGEYIAKALPLIMKNRRPRPYEGKPRGFIVALGGKWAIVNYGGLYWKGYFGYLAREFSHWNYFRKILGWRKAFAYVVFQARVYGRND